MQYQERIQALRERHKQLDVKLHELSLRPQPDEQELQELKRSKLALKDEISRLEGDTTSIH